MSGGESTAVEHVLVSKLSLDARPVSAAAKRRDDLSEMEEVPAKVVKLAMGFPGGGGLGKSA